MKIYVFVLAFGLFFYGMNRSIQSHNAMIKRCIADGHKDYECVGRSK